MPVTWWHARAAVFKRVVALAALAGALATAYWAGHRRMLPRPPAPASAGVPYVGFVPSEMDLGDQLWDQVVPLEFTFINESADAIVVQTAYTSCDCTVIDRARYEDRAVGPGGSLSLEVEFHTLKSPGLKHRRIDFVSADGRRYSARIHVNVQGTWNLEPDVVDFGEISLDGDRTPVVRNAVFLSESDTLIDVSSPGSPWLECRSQPTATGQADLVLRVLPERLPPGQNSASVVVRTSSSTKSSGVIYVKARGIHELVPSPDPILLMGDKRQRVELRGRAGQPVRAVSAESGHEHIRIELHEDGAFDVWNSGGPFSEAVPIRVVAENGRARVIYISAF